MRRAAILVAFLATGALSVPTGERWENKCAEFCVTADTGRATFQAGKTHVYQYSSDVITTLASATDEASRLHVTATAELTANSGCDLTLQLREVTLKDSDPKDDRSRQEVDNMATFKQELERWPLHLSYQNGRIEELCANPNEPVWVLNFKRGLLSTLVNSVKSMDVGESQRKETDVTGECLTDYTVAEHGDSLLITKSKDLLTCSGRGHLISSLQSTPYTSASQVQSLPLIKSTLQCEQKMSEGRLVSTECRESHLFRPFSQGENGAVTHTTVRLTQMTVRNAVQNYDEDLPTTRRSLLFDHADAELTQQNRVPAATALLAQLEAKTADGVRPEVPHLFTRLVRMLRHFDESGLTQLDRQLDADSAARRYFVDALPLAGTAPAMALMRDLLRSSQVTDETADRWMTALAFVHEPSLEMVAAVAPMLEDPSARRQTLLGVSSLVYHYCERNAACAEEAPVRQVVGQLERTLGSGCRANSEDEEMRMLTALKALGNAGRLTDGAATLRSCFENDNTMEVRLAAIGAFRRMPCGTVADSGLMNTFANEREDTEVRIAAYLAVMQCPTHDIVDKVQEILSTETVNQVSSFVWSHLTNMQETGDPTKRYMKSLLYNVDLANKFNTDVRKFSRYFEKTMFFESMNAGATVDANVVFTPESYLPKSGVFNFTVDLFGQAINLLEVGGRVEGLEDFSESLFGSKGIYPQEAISQILKTMRGRQTNDLSSRRIQSPKASAYMKIFGNELRFDKYDSLNELADSLGANSPLDFLQKLAKDMDWTENYQFLDSAYTIPTISGFPFTLKATGTATVSLKTGGSFEVQSWDKINIDGHIKPSAAVEIMSEMLVDAHVAHTGLKMNANLHTSTVFDGHAVVDTGKLVSVRINMPRDKVEILDVNTRFYSVFRNKARKLEMETGNRFELKACSDRYISTDLLGINFCADVSYSRGSEALPSCLISGPLTARFTVEKTDDFKAFEFEYRHSNEAGIRKSNLVIDTVGSAIDRRINIDYMVNFERNEFQAGFRTPIKSMDVSGVLDVVGQTKRADVSLKMDERELFGVTSSLEIEDTPITVRYSPSLSVRGPAGELANFAGSLIANKNKHKYNVDLAITKVFQTPIVFKGSLNEADDTYSVATSMESFVLDGNMKGTFRIAGDNLLIQTNTVYSFMNGERQTISINSKLSEYERDDLTTYRLFMDTKFSAFPLLDCQLTAEHQESADHYQSRVVLTREDRAYELSTLLQHGEDKMAASLGFVAQHWNIDFKLAGEVDFSKDNKMLMAAEAQLNKEKFVKASLGLDYKSEEGGFNYGVSTELVLPSATYTLRTGVRQEEQAAHLRVMLVRETASARDEVALVAAFALEEDELSGELTLSAPHYPRYQLTGRLVPGTNGVYLARALVQAGPLTYTAGAELKLAAPEQVLHLLLEAPGRRYSALVSALLAGDRPQVTADLRFGRRVTAALAANLYPSENTGNFEIFWNKDVDDTQKASVEILLRGMDMAASLTYPGRQVKLDAALTADGWTADLEYAPSKVIHMVGGMLPTGSMSNGLKVFANVNTPIEGFTTMSLTFTNKPAMGENGILQNFEVVGSVEGQEARLTGRLLLDLFNLGFSDSQAIKTELDLLTPVPGWEHSQLTFNYFMDSHTFTARVLAAKNDDQVALGGTFEMFQLPEVFKISTVLDLALPTDLLRKGKVGFDLKFAETNLDAGVLVQWKAIREQELSLTLNSQHTVGHEVHIDSTVTLKTPFENFEHFSSNLKIDHSDYLLNALIDFKHADTSIFHTELLTSSTGMSRKGKFIFNCAKCPGLDASYDLALTGQYSFSISSHWQGQETSLSGKYASTHMEDGSAKTDSSVIMILPTESRTYAVHQRHEINIPEGKMVEHSEVSWGSKQITVDMNSKWTTKQDSQGDMDSMTITGYGEMTTPFQGWESAKISQTSKVSGLKTGKPSYSGETQILTNGDKTIEITDTFELQDVFNWQLRRELVSNSRWVSHASGSLRLSGHPYNFKFTSDAEWDEETAQFVCSNEIGMSDFAASVTGNWFGGVTRVLKVATRNAAEAIYPSLDITYNHDKTIRVYGSIAKGLEAGESSLTLEAPYTERAVLTVSHNLDKKKITVDYLHGNKRYSADMNVKVKVSLLSDAKLDIKFISPRNCMGAGSVSLKYDLQDDLKLKGKLTHNDWEFSLDGKLDMEKGHFDVNTPYPGFTLLSASYICKGDEAEMRLKRENNQILIVANRLGSSDMLTYSIRVNTPYYGYETMTLTVNKPSNQDSFTAEYMRGRHTSVSITTEYGLSGPSSWVSIEAQSSFEGLSTSALHLSYNLIGQTAKAMFTKEGRKIEANVVAELSALYSKLSVGYLNNLVGGPKQLTMTGMYNIQDIKKSLEIVVVKDAERFMLGGNAQLTAESSFLILDIASPMRGCESAKFVARFDYSPKTTTARLELSRNEDTMEALFEAEEESETGKVTFAIHTPFEEYQLTKLTAEYDTSALPMHAKLSAERNSNKYDIIASMEERDDSLLLSLTTPFAGFEQLSMEGSHVDLGAGKSTRFVITRNQDQIRVVLDTELSWTKSIIALEATSPFQEALSLRFSVRYDFQSEQKTFVVLMARNDKQFQMNAYGVMKRGAATGLIELNTPVADWENVKYQGTYDLNTEEKIMEISYERNGVKNVIASRGSYDGEAAYVDVITPLEGYETMGINGRYVSKRGKREVGYDAHVNDHRHRLHILYERVGMESAKLKIETPIHDMHLIEVDARSQVFSDGVGYYINTNRDGKRNSMEIRTVKEDSSVGVDIAVKSYIEGLENLQLSGNVVYRGRKRSFSFKSNRGGNQAEISGEVVMKKRAGNGKIKAALPIQGWEDVDVSFDYKIGRKNSFRLTSKRDGVTREYSGDLQYTQSSFTVNLNTPYNGFKKLHADASRTEGPDGKISADINLQRGTRKVGISYDYQFSDYSGSANIAVTTPYDGFRTMMSTLEYNMGANSRSITFKAKRDAREWNLQTSRTWERGMDEGSITLETPIEEIRLVKFSRSFNIQNLAAMTYEAAYQRNQRKFSLSGTGGIKRKGKKVSFDITISTPLEVGDLGAKVNYDFTKQPKEIHAKLTAGARYANLDASVGASAGTINLVTTNKMLPKADVTYYAEIEDNKRDVKASLVLADGRTLQLDYLADYTMPEKGNGHIELKSTTYGDRKLTWDYQTPGDDLTGSVTYVSPNGNLDWSISVDGKAYVRRKVVIKSTIASEVYSSTWTATLRYNTKNGFYTNNKLRYNGKVYTLVFDAKTKAGKRVVSLTYDGQILKGIKIDGTWTLPTNPSARKEFDITYKRGDRTASLEGFVSLGASRKSGSFDIHLTTPFEEVKDLHVTSNWDFVLPNRILNINYNRNKGKAVTLSFAGNRQEQNGVPYGDYTLSLTMPPVEVKPGKFIDEYTIKFSFDLRYGYLFKVSQLKPFNEVLELDIKTTDYARTIKVLYDFMDEHKIVPYMPNTHILFNSKRTIRPVGPKIELDLETNFDGFENIEVDIDVNRGLETNKYTVDYKRGDKVGHLTAVVAKTDAGGSINFNVQTPIEGFEDVSLSGSYEHQPGVSYGLNIDYSRGQKFVRLTSSVKLDIQKQYGVLQSGSIDAQLKLDSMITMPIDLLVTLDGSMESQPRRSGNGKLVVTLNGDTWSLTHRVNRAEAGRRTARLVIATPLKYPYKKITYNGDVSLASNKAVFTVEYGKKKVELDLSWFAGEARQYGAEIRLTTPFKPVQSLELDVKATVQPRADAVDVMVHYRRGQKMVHVTGTVKPWWVDLHFETPTFGNFAFKGGVIVDRGGRYNAVAVTVEGLVTLASGAAVGGKVTVKPVYINDIQVMIDIHTPAPGWERLNVDVAYTNIENSNIMRVAFESPMTKRVELSFELTNLTDGPTTDFRAGVTTNYLGNAFTFRTNILRDPRGMKYELELESPYHLLPSFKLTGRR